MLPSSDELSQCLKQAVETGNKENYNKFIIILQTASCNDGTLHSYLQSLRHSVSLMNFRHHAELFQFLFKISSVDCDDDTWIVYSQLMVDIVLTHPQNAIEVLICRLRTLKTLDSHASFSRRTGHLLNLLCEKSQVCARNFVKSLQRSAPYITLEGDVHLNYCTHLFNIASKHLKPFRTDIYLTVFDHIIKYDLHTYNVFRKCASDANVDGAIFELESPTNEVVQIFDSLMCLCFEFLKKQYAKNPKQIYKFSLILFDMLFLTSHATLHSSYILFYLYSLDAEFIEDFLDYLWRKFRSHSSTQFEKQMAINYIAGFLSNAAYIPVESKQKRMCIIADWIQSYIRLREPLDNSYHAALYSMFYFTCQALMYIFNNTYWQFLDSSDCSAFFKQLHFEQMIHSLLNPLKHCLKSIVNTFASLTRMYQAAFCYNIIEVNNRNAFHYSESAMNDQDRNRLSISQENTFYPFEPYLLSKSAQYINGLYLEKPVLRTNSISENSDDESHIYGRTSDSIVGLIQDSEMLSLSPHIS